MMKITIISLFLIGWFYTIESQRILVLRVTINGTAPQSNSTFIVNRIFFDSDSLASNYRICSNQKINVVPATGNKHIMNGLVEFSVTDSLSISKLAALKSVGHINEIVLPLLNQTWPNIWGLYDHIMVYAPAGPWCYWTGVAPKPGMWSEYCDFDKGPSASVNNFPYPVVAMHELGHNFGLDHSGNGTAGDPFDLMGTLSQLSFNGAKFFQLGLWSDHSKTVYLNSGSSWTLQLISYKYAVSNGGNVAVKVASDSSSKMAYYLHLQMRDIVPGKPIAFRGIAIVKSPDGSIVPSEPQRSNLMAVIGYTADKFQYPNSYSTTEFGGTVTFEVTSLSEYTYPYAATVTITKH